MSREDGIAHGMTVMTFLITSFGTITTASYGVGTNVLNFVVVPAMGFSMATSTLVGQNIGANNIARAEKLQSRGSSLSRKYDSIMKLEPWRLAAPRQAHVPIPQDADADLLPYEFVQSCANLC